LIIVKKKEKRKTESPDVVRGPHLSPHTEKKRIADLTFDGCRERGAKELYFKSASRERMRNDGEEFNT